MNYNNNKSFARTLFCGVPPKKSASHRRTKGDPIWPRSISIPARLPGREKKFIFIAVALVLIAAAVVVYAAGSWSSGSADWLLTQRVHRGTDRILTFQALPADQYQDAVARAMAAQVTGDQGEEKKYFAQSPWDLLPGGKELVVTLLETAEPPAASNSRQVTVTFETGEQFTVTVVRQDGTCRIADSGQQEQ